MKTCLFVTVLWCLLGFEPLMAQSQDSPAQRPLDPPTNVGGGAEETVVADPIQVKVNDLISCQRPANRGFQVWQLMVIGDSDDAKLNYVKALDAASVHSVTGISGVSNHVTTMTDVLQMRSIKIWYNHDLFKRLHDHSMGGDQEDVRREIEKYSVDSFLKSLLNIDGVQISCMSQAQRSMLAPRSGVTGSN